MSATATFVLESAAKLLGKLRPGYTLSTVEKNDALPFLNGLVQQYSTRRTFMFSVIAQRFTLTPIPGSGPDGSYTVGPGGDFPTVRPTFIKNANLILTGSTPNVRVPLDIWDDDQWAATRVQTIPTTVPVAIYYDKNLGSTNGRGNIYFWGQPTQGNDFEFFAPAFLTEFPDLTTAVELAEGYQEMLVTSAAERLAPTWGITVSPMVVEQARRARTAIQSLNSTAPGMSNDAASMTSQGLRPSFNWRTGSLR